MTKFEDRIDSIFEVTGDLITKLRSFRNRIQARKHGVMSDIDDLRTLIDTLRHRTEMYNNERADNI